MNKNQTRRVFIKRAGLGLASLAIGTPFLKSYSQNISFDNGLYNEQYRPQFHLTPPYGWMNDPCGMVYYSGEYHLQYQANPGNPKGWGSQWSHVVSKDLINWTNLSPSLIQDKKYGGCSTGSCVVDWKNASGFQTGSEKVIVMVFTITNPGQVQGLAFSNDRGRTWKRYPGNPVIVANDGNQDFRDPKVFWFESLKKWVMVVSRGYTPSGDIFQSADLKNWEHTGKALNGECPDMFRLQVQGGKEVKWLYLCGDYPMAPNGTGAKYCIGNFDGKEFQTESGPLRLAGNFFVGQSFGDIPSTDGRRIWIGWKWLSDEGEFGPWTGGFQTIPVELNLRNLPGKGLQLCYNPVRELQTLRTTAYKFHNQTIDVNCSVITDKHIEGELFECFAEFQLDSAKEFGLEFRKGVDKKCIVGYRTREQKVFFIDEEGKEKIAQLLEPQNGVVKLHVLIDRSVVDIFGNDGATWNCSFFKSDPQDRKMELYAKEGKVKLLSMQLWKLRKQQIQ